MASRSRTRTAPTVAPEPVAAPETPTNSYGPAEGGNAIATSYRGLHNLFGLTFEGFTISSEGFTFTGLAVAEGYDLDTIINDIFRRGDKTVNPRLDFLELYPLINGETPAPFTNAAQITAWMVKHMKGGSRSPKYAKDANQRYKEVNGFAVPRGRPRKVLHLRFTDSGELDPAALVDVEPQEIEKLRNVLNERAAVEA